MGFCKNLKLRLLWLSPLLCLAFACDDESRTDIFVDNMSVAIRLSTCLGADVGQVMDQLSQASGASSESSVQQQFDCLMSARSCDAVLRCFDATGERCTESNTGDTCRGSLRTYCDLSIVQGVGLIREMDCAADVNGNYACHVVDSCAGIAPEDREFSDCYQRSTCRARVCDLEGARCDGNTVISCDDGSETRFDCSQIDLNCAQVGGRAECVQDSLETCFESECSGGWLTVCSGGVVTERVNCRDYHPDFQCIESEGQARCGVSIPNQVCDDGQTECLDESNVGVCVQGAWVNGLCSSFLNGSCTSSQGGTQCVRGEETPEPEPESPMPAEPEGIPCQTERNCPDGQLCDPRSQTCVQSSTPMEPEQPMMPMEPMEPEVDPSADECELICTEMIARGEQCGRPFPTDVQSCISTCVSDESLKTTLLYCSSADCSDLSCP